MMNPAILRLENKAVRILNKNGLRMFEEKPVRILYGKESQKIITYGVPLANVSRQMESTRPKLVPDIDQEIMIGRFLEKIISFIID